MGLFSRLFYRISDKVHTVFHRVFGWVIFTNELHKYSKYEIWDYTYWYPEITDGGTNYTVKIWKFCSIATNVQMMVGTSHRIDRLSTYPFVLLDKNKSMSYNLTKWDIVVGHDVRIGKNVTILDGVTIWHGAVIATGAVVTKNIEPYAIVWWIPAKLIKYRFDKNTIDDLLTIKRWNRPKEKIKYNIDILASANIDKLKNNI